MLHLDAAPRFSIQIHILASCRISSELGLKIPIKVVLLFINLIFCEGGSQEYTTSSFVAWFLHADFLTKRLKKRMYLCLEP